MPIAEKNCEAWLWAAISLSVLLRGGDGWRSETVMKISGKLHNIFLTFSPVLEIEDGESYMSFSFQISKVCHIL